MGYYVGLRTRKREVFRAPETPTQASHGNLYHSCIGPFRTKWGAQWVADNPGGGNPPSKRLSVSPLDQPIPYIPTIDLPIPYIPV